MFHGQHEVGMHQASITVEDQLNPIELDWNGMGWTGNQIPEQQSDNSKDGLSFMNLEPKALYLQIPPLAVVIILWKG